MNKIFGLLFFIFSTLLTAQEPPSFEEVEPQSQVNPGCFFDTYYFKTYEKRFYDLYQGGPFATRLELAMDREKFISLVKLFIENSYLRQDGNDSDDVLNFDWDKNLVFVMTNTEDELKNVLALLSQFEDLSISRAAKERMESERRHESAEDFRELRVFSRLSTSELSSRIRQLEKAYGLDSLVYFQEIDRTQNPDYYSVEFKIPIDVPSEFYSKLESYLTSVRESLRISYNYNIIHDEVLKFMERNKNDFEYFEFINLRQDSKSIYFELSLSKYEALLSLIRSYDVAPFQLRVKANVVEVDRALQKSLGANIQNFRSGEGETNVLNWISNFFGNTAANQANLALQLGKSSLEVLIQAIETSGRGQRLLIPEILTMEILDGNGKPVIIESKVFPNGLGLSSPNLGAPAYDYNAPQNDIPQNQNYSAYDQTAGIGFKMKLNRVQVVESPQTRLWREFTNQIQRTLLDQETFEELMDFSSRLEMAYFEDMDWEKIELGYSFFRGLKDQAKSLASELRISTDAYIEDGSVLRFQASSKSNEASVDVHRSVLDFNIVTDNGETVFLGGSTASSESEYVQKVPLLGDIPLLGNLFRSKALEKKDRSTVVFLTLSIEEPPSMNVMGRTSNFSIKELKSKLSNPLFTEKLSETAWLYNYGKYALEVEDKLHLSGLPEYVPLVLCRYLWSKTFERYFKPEKNPAKQFQSVLKYLLEPRLDAPSVWTEAVLDTQKFANDNFGLELEPLEILALFRTEGWIGGDIELWGQTDERMNWLLANALAREVGPIQSLYPNLKTYEKFQKLIPQLERSSWRNSLESFESYYRSQL